MMESELKAAMLMCVAEYGQKHGLKLSTIAMRAVRDARFFDRVVAGKSFTVRTYDRVMQYLSDDWPDDADWPVQVARPNRSPSLPF